LPHWSGGEAGPTRSGQRNIIATSVQLDAAAARPAAATNASTRRCTSGSGVGVGPAAAAGPRTPAATSRRRGSLVAAMCKVCGAEGLYSATGAGRGHGAETDGRRKKASPARPLGRATPHGSACQHERRGRFRGRCARTRRHGPGGARLRAAPRRCCRDAPARPPACGPGRRRQPPRRAAGSVCLCAPTASCQSLLGTGARGRARTCFCRDSAAASLRSRSASVVAARPASTGAAASSCTLLQQAPMLAVDGWVGNAGRGDAGAGTAGAAAWGPRVGTGGGAGYAGSGVRGSVGEAEAAGVTDVDAVRAHVKTALLVEGTTASAAAWANALATLGPAWVHAGAPYRPMYMSVTGWLTHRRGGGEARRRTLRRSRCAPPRSTMRRWLWWIAAGCPCAWPKLAPGTARCLWTSARAVPPRRWGSGWGCPDA
jgi:hypothetical protein